MKFAKCGILEIMKYYYDNGILFGTYIHTQACLPTYIHTYEKYMKYYSSASDKLLMSKHFFPITETSSVLDLLRDKI